ncbi:MAG: hypothetical protein ABSH12_08265 [Endomicrobiales bacterium]
MPKKTMMVKDIGEFGLISRIRAKVSGGSRLPVEIGDDAFVADIAGGSSMVGFGCNGGV